MRPPIRTNCWFRITSSIVLAVVVLLSPIRTPQTPNTRVYPNGLCKNFSLASHRSGLGLTSVTPEQTSVESDPRDFEEEDEDESFWLFSHLVDSISILLSSPSQFLSGTCPGNSPPRAVAVPLRC